MNCWMHSSGERHEKAFKNIALDWARENWGTKWNAYKAKPPEIEGEDVYLIFETAWRPPMGWICAVFNSLNLSFDHNWLSEDDDGGHSDRFDVSQNDNSFGDPWIEGKASEGMHRHLHLLLWGVETFEDEE